MFAFRSSILILLLSLALLVSCGRAERKARRTPAAPSNTYTLGEVINFGRAGRSDRFKRGGWGETEKDYTWTNGHSAKLAFTIADADQPLRLRMRLAGFTNPPVLTYQPVEVLVNDETMADWEVSDAGDFVALIPAEVANHEQLIVTLRTPEAISPKVLDVGEDNRVLGVSVRELEITKPDEEEARRAVEQYESNDPRQARGRGYSFGKVVGLGLGAGGQRFKISGWHAPEPQFTWTGKDPAILEFDIPASERPLALRMKLEGLFEPRTLPYQPTQVFIDGKKVTEWLVSAPAEFRAAIPPEVSSRGGALRIELRTPKAISPKALKIGDDTRILGVRCAAVAITEEDVADLETAPSPSPTPRG